MGRRMLGNPRIRQVRRKRAAPIARTYPSYLERMEHKRRVKQLRYQLDPLIEFMGEAQRRMLKAQLCPPRLIAPVRVESLSEAIRRHICSFVGKTHA